MFKTSIKTLSLAAALALTTAGAWAQTSDTTPPVAPSPSGNSPAPQVSNKQGAMGNAAGTNANTMGTTGNMGTTNTTGTTGNMGTTNTMGTTGTLSNNDATMSGNRSNMRNTSNNRMRNRAARADRN